MRSIPRDGIVSAHASQIATQRLIDASATLDAPDRALLNIWVSRGLDVAAVARMTGVSEKAIADRRIRIVEHLSSVLNLPEDHVRNALVEITAPADARPAGSAPPEPVSPQDGAGTRVESAGARQRGRRLWGVAALVTVVAFVIVLLASTAPGHHATTTDARAPASRSTSSRAPATTPSSAARLAALPGGVAGASGNVSVTGQRPTLKLNLSVRGLPPISRGHYVAWLYTSLVNSKPLGQLPSGAGHVSLRLPSKASRYYWIDISYQPPGVVFHSGDSLLRVANPLHARR